MIQPFTPAQLRLAIAACDRANKQAAKALRDELIHKLYSDGVPARLIAGVFNLTPSRIQQITRLWK